MRLVDDLLFAVKQSRSHRSGTLTVISSVCIATLVATPVAAVQDAPTIAEMASATYRGIEESPITLVDGRWEGTPAVEGSASVPQVDLAPRFRLVADLNGDGREEAMALLYYNFGGSGVFSYLAVLERDDENRPQNISTVEIGDRVQIRSAAVGGEEITIETVEAGPNDGACCPGQKRRRTFAFDGKTLVERVNEDQGRLSIADLDGTTWRLIQWSRDEYAEPRTEIDIQFDGGRIYGNSGCNRYQGTIEAGELAGDFSVVAPLAATRMACPPPTDAVEDRYLETLQLAQRFRFVATELVLDWSDDQTWGSLTFENTGEGMLK